MKVCRGVECLLLCASVWLCVSGWIAASEAQSALTFQPAVVTTIACVGLGSASMARHSATIPGRTFSRGGA